MKRRAATVIALAVMGASSSAFGVVTITETFDTDPIARGWYGVGNTTAPNNYGFSNTDNTTTSPNPYWGGPATGAGEVGGTINRGPNAYYGVDLGGPVDFATNDMSVEGIIYLQSRGSSTTLRLGWGQGTATSDPPPENGDNPGAFLGIAWDDGWNGANGLSARSATSGIAGGDGPSFDPTVENNVPIPFRMNWVASTGTFTMDLNGTIGTMVLDSGQIAELPALTHWQMFGRVDASPDNANVLWLDDIRFTAAAAVTTPPTPTWLVDNSGDWATSSNWNAGLVPNAVGAEAVFGGVITADRLVYTNSNVTVGTMSFNDDNTYLLAGLGTVTLDDTDDAAEVNVALGTHKINLPLVVADNTTLNVAGGATLKISDPVTINAGKTLSQSGAGTVTYESTVDVLAGGGFAMAGSAHLASLSMAATANTTVAAGGNKTLTVDALSMNSTSKLDLNDNDLVVNGGNFSTIRALVLQGLSSSPDPSKTGIISSTGQADGDKVLAVVDNNLAGLTQLSGQTVASNAVLGKYTYFGDMNLDGQVTGDDYPLIDLNLNTTPVPGIAWLKGDANLDGNVTGDDYPLIDLNLGKGVGNPLSAAAVAVPEPAGLALLAAAGAGLLIRRRRQI